MKAYRTYSNKCNVKLFLLPFIALVLVLSFTLNTVAAEMTDSKEEKPVTLSSAAVGNDAIQVNDEKFLLSPALYIIAAKKSIARSGIAGETLVFSEEVFLRGINLSKIEAITVISLPDEESGKLMLGTTLVSEGQRISGTNLDALVFSPAGNERISTDFVFSVYDYGYPITCSIYLLNRPNATPTASLANGEKGVLEAALNRSTVGTLYGSDPEGDALRFMIVDLPAHGVIILNDEKNGKYTYYPENGYTGTDSFGYVVFDCFGNCSAAETVTVNK